MRIETRGSMLPSAPAIRNVLRACAVVASAAAMGVAPVHADTGAAKTLARIHDPVVMPGSTLAGVAGQHTDAFRLMRIESGQPVPIPFQFDERDDDGDVVVDGARDFVFDNNDELVFMAADTGDRAVGDLWPRSCTSVLEIAVVDPRNDKRGWAYLLTCPDAGPPPTTEPYVTYDVRTNRARSAFYETQYAAGRNYFTSLRVAGKGGALGPNLLRRTMMRGLPTFSMLFTTVQLEFTEQNSIVRIDGVKNGPVRAIRKVGLSVDLGPLFPDLPNGTAYTYHYRTSYVTPTRFGIPSLALRILREFSFEAVVDFDPKAMPLRYWDAVHDDGVALNAAADGPVITSVDHDWWVHSGSGGAMLHAFIIPERWRNWGIVRGTVLREHAAGYSLLNMTRLREGGDYDLLQAAIVLPDPYHAGDEAEPMAMVHDPLTTELRRLR